MDLDGNVSHHGPSTVTTSSAPESGDTADTETENTSVTEAEAVDDSKIEEPSTDKADYGADSDRSNLSEGSVGDSLGSRVLNSTSPFNEADATESGTWINEPPLPRNEDGSDILLRPLHPENPQILRNETQGATTALQSDTDGLNYKIMLVKGTVAVVDLLTALVVGVVMRRRGSETLVVLTVDLLILTAGVVMLDAL